MDPSGRPGGRRRINQPWWRDPGTVDGYQAEGVQWPMETSRFAYLAPFGGFAEDLAQGHVGLNEQALYENTDLQPGDHVTVQVFEDHRPIPLLVQPTFEVVPLGFETPDAFLHSTEGEAVLSVRDVDRRYVGLDRQTQDLRVVLNGVLACQGRRSGA